MDKRRLSAFAGGCFCLIALLLPSRALAGRDFAKYPAIVQFEMPKELYAVGDVHGDYKRLADLLAAAHLISDRPDKPASAHWIGGAAVLVCTGDMIDKYDHSLGVIALFRALQQQLLASGGRVIITLGNHEAEFLASDGVDKKSSDFADELQAAGIPVGDVLSGKDRDGIGEWMSNLPIAAKVGDWFFCHAGNTGGLSVKQLTDETEKQFAQHGFDSPIVLDPNSLLEARMHPRPWWEWDGTEPAIHNANSARPQTAAEDRLKSIINALGCKHLVFGHQPGKVDFSDGTRRKEGEMFSKFGGLVFMIDTGMSRGVSSGRGALLRIKDNSGSQKVDAVYADGTIKSLGQ